MQKSDHVQAGTSLRERRRERTWTAIHKAALRLARERGVRSTTIEDIAADVSISPRTFFNYFPTKEDAILGLRPPAFTDDLLAGDQEHETENLINRTAHLLLHMVRSSVNFSNHEEFYERIEEFPEFKHRLKMHHLACEQVLIDYLNTVDWDAFAQSGSRGKFPHLPEGQTPTSTAEERTRATVQLASAVLRQVHFAHNLTDEADVTQQIQHAVKTFQTLLKDN